MLRSEASLSAALGALGALAGTLSRDVPASRRTWEGTNLVTVATGVVAAALMRTESRGCHRRADHPESSDAWRRHLTVTLDPVGTIVVDEGDVS